MVTASMGNIKQTSLSNLVVVIQGGLGTANCLGSEITPFPNTLVSWYTNGNLLVKLIQTRSHEQDHCLPQTVAIATMLNVVYGVFCSTNHDSPCAQSQVSYTCMKFNVVAVLQTIYTLSLIFLIIIVV